MAESLSTEELAALERHVEVCATLGRTVMLTPQDALRLIAMVRREPVVCPDCRGSGGYVCEPCNACHGTGAVWKEGA